MTLSTEQLVKTVRAWQETGSYGRAAKVLGLNEAAVGQRVRKAARLGLVDFDLPAPGFEISQHSATYDAEGNITQQWVKTKPEAGEVFAPLPGHIIKGETAFVNAEGQIVAKWVKTKEDAVGAGLLEALDKVLASYDGRFPIIDKDSGPCLTESLTVYPIPDLHFGMYSWGEETGLDYNTDIATELMNSTVARLVRRSEPTKKAVILGLGDYFHANDAKAATPESGNRLDVDGRWAQVFSMGAHLAVAMVDMVARHHEEVEVVFLRGNHDPDSAMSLTVALRLFYSKTPRIFINPNPGIAWYYRFGSCLLGATHGHTMKPDRMAMMLASDRPADWGETTYRHFFFGHIHTETAREVGPVRVESFNTPAPRDGWANSKGFRSGRSMNAITFDMKQGEVGRHRINLL